MGTNCVPLLTDLFLYSYEAEFINHLLHEKNEPFPMAFNSTFWYIDDVLSINNDQFHYLDSIYPSEVDIKDTTESSVSASFLDVLLNMNASGKLTTQLYDIRDDFNFAIVNFPYICSNIPQSPASLNRFDMQGPALHTISFWIGVNYWQTSWCYRDFYNSVWCQRFVIAMAVTMI
jgi:hypothetical protein